MVSGVEEELEIKRFLKMVKQPGLVTAVLVFSEDIAGCVERSKWNKWNGIRWDQPEQRWSGECG